MPSEYIVDNLTFLSGLDQLYRKKMKVQERGELLTCARQLARKVKAVKADVPVEGYYSEDEELSEYFLLLRGLQDVDRNRVSLSSSYKPYKRLMEVTSSGLYGEPDPDLSDKLLPRYKDVLFEAMQDLDWKIKPIMKKAKKIAEQSDDFSLVALAVLSGEPLMVAGMRESVVLHANWRTWAAKRKPPRYIWKVDSLLETRATQFVKTFNSLFTNRLPIPCEENAKIFYDAEDLIKMMGRCAAIGYHPDQSRFYHWAITEDLKVIDFWDADLWTTERFKDGLFGGKLPAEYKESW